MTSTPLDSLLATAQEYIASDLHIIAGVPPAFRVSGEIILAQSVRGKLALSPTLSPRRGCAMQAIDKLKRLARVLCASNAAKAPVLIQTVVALPLLAERVGLRAEHLNRSCPCSPPPLRRMDECPVP